MLSPLPLGLPDLSHFPRAMSLLLSSFSGAELLHPGDSGASSYPTPRVSLASGKAGAVLLNGIYSLSDGPYLSRLLAYASPPLNASRIPWSSRGICVYFPLSFR